MELSFRTADYNDPKDAQVVVDLLNQYALDPMGGGEALSGSVKACLVEKLAALPTAFSVIGYVDKSTPIALANCFMGFSTFKAKPLVNIHDCYVNTQYQGLQVGQRLLAEIESIARDRGCCKVTLEVLEGNLRAQAAYKKFGFSSYALDEDNGSALFWEKALV